MRQRQLQSLLEAPEAMPAEGRIELISSLTTEERATYRNVVKRGGNQDLLEEYIAKHRLVPHVPLFPFPRISVSPYHCE